MNLVELEAVDDLESIKVPNDNISLKNQARSVFEFQRVSFRIAMRESVIFTS